MNPASLNFNFTISIAVGSTARKIVLRAEIDDCLPGCAYTVHNFYTRKLTGSVRGIDAGHCLIRVRGFLVWKQEHRNGRGRRLCHGRFALMHHPADKTLLPLLQE